VEDCHPHQGVVGLGVGRVVLCGDLGERGPPGGVEIHPGLVVLVAFLV
jgi:hypothetical protein